jgi:N-acetylneuraminate lyase
MRQRLQEGEPMAQRLTGLIAAPFTPLRPDGSLNPDGVKPLAELLARNGVRGAFLCGSTGESLSLAVDERRQSLELWRRAAPEGLALIAHVGHNCVAEARRLAAHAAETGADAVAAMPPVFFKPQSIDELIDYCEAVASAAGALPFYYYHIPAKTGVDLPMRAFLDAAGERLPTLAGLKFTHGDLVDFAECLQAAEGRYNILFGRDEMLLAGLAMGAPGGIGTTYTFAAPLYLELIEAFEAGEMAKARSLQYRATAMIRALQGTGLGLPAFKPIMKFLGVDCGPVRPPLRPVTEAEEAEVRRRLEALDFFAYACR